MPRWLKQRLLQQQTTEGGDNGSGTAAPAVAPEVQAQIDAATSGLKNKNGELLGKLKAAGDELRRFEGIDPDAVRTILKRFTDDEEAALIASGKLDEVLSKRTERMQQDFTKKLEAEQHEVGRAHAANRKLADRALAQAIVNAAAKCGALPEALDDIVLRAKASGWTVNEDGDVVALKDGDTVLGKDGKTPLSPHEWADSLRENAPHLWPRVQGTGATGAAYSRSAPDLSQLSPAERITKARELGLTPH